MSEENPFDKEKALKTKLDQYQVSVPDFSRKRTWMDRVANYLFAPGKNPLEHTEMTGLTLTALTVMPAVVSAIVFFVMALLIGM